MPRRRPAHLTGCPFGLAEVAILSVLGYFACSGLPRTGVPLGAAPYGPHWTSSYLPHRASRRRRGISVPCELCYHPEKICDVITPRPRALASPALPLLASLVLGSTRDALPKCLAPIPGRVTLRRASQACLTQKQGATCAGGNGSCPVPDERWFRRECLDINHQRPSSRLSDR
jgi:hypothetical protein